MKDAVILLLCAVALAHAINQGPDQISRTCNCDPSEAQQICQANYDNDDVLIAHENCNQFYKCANGIPVAYFCPNDLLYNPFSETCEWSNNVDCGERPIAEGPGKEEDSGSDDVSEVDNDWTCNCNPGEAPSICAAEDSNGILVAHQNCNQFYMCAEGRPVTLDCSAPLLYNPYKEACDWAHNVECGERVIPDPKEDDSSDDKDSTENDGTCNCNPEEAPAICAAPGSESELIAHENCNKYYICNHGLPIAVSCFEDLLFNPYTRECDWPRNVDCGDRLVPETECTGCNDNASNDASCDDDGVTTPSQDTQAPPLGPEDSDSSDIHPPGDDVVVPLPPSGTCNCNPEEAPSICAADESSGVLVAHENCNKFYKCDRGKPVVFICHGDLLYNPYTEQCDWPENVDCGDRVTSDPDDTASSPGVTKPADSTPGNNCDPSEAPAICAADDSEGVLVAHENCNQFYKCSEGIPVALICPPSLLFNPAKEQCDWPENVECGDRVIPDPNDNVSTPGVTNPGETNPDVTNPGETNPDMTNPDVTNPDMTNPDNSTPGNNCDPSEAPAICAADNSEGVLVAHENCDQFYKCSEGKPVAFICPPNLLFNPAKDQCDWPENVDCGERVIPAPESSGSDSSDIRPPGDDVVVATRPPGTCNCNPVEAVSICAAEDSSGVLVAHENCNQFYKCDQGKPVGLTCHGDLLYNPYTEQCDWPENVDCGDRVIPVPDDSVSTPDVTNPGDTNPGVTNPGVTNPGETNPGVTNPANTTPGNNCDPSEAPVICAADDSEGVLVAHENCNQFYVCSEGKPVALSCPSNLLFNPAKDQCDWPENVDCGDRVIPDPDDSVSIPDVTNPGDTNPGVTNPGETNPGVTNPADTTPGNNCEPSEAPVICAADDSEGVLVAHENCNQFYVCSEGKPVALSCPSNLLFNPAKDQCDWPEAVDCGDRVIPDTDDSVSTPGVSNPGETNPGVTNPGETNPGVTNPGETNPDMTNPDVTNPDMTNPDNSTPGNNCDPSEAPAICAADDSEGVLVAHENCNQFYVCSEGKPVALSCPSNLLFNPAKDQCDWPEAVDCGNRVIPDTDDSVSTPGVTNPGETNPGVTNPGETNPDVTNPGETNPDVTNPDMTNPDNSTPGNNCDPSEAPAICAADNSEGVLVAHENCDQFYKCSEGKPVAFICPPNLLFNPAKDQCDWPENVDCGERVIPGPESSGSDSSDIRPPGDDVVVATQPPGTCNCNPEEAVSICAAEDSSGVLVAHENCNQFYKCDQGKPVGLTCHGDLLYNPYTEQCDWPENVDCGDRVIPVPDDSVSTPDVTNPGDTNPGVTNPGVTNPGETNPGVTNPADTTPGNNCDPSEAPVICAADDSEGVLVAHENCNQFYVCSEGKPVALSCPSNLLFNPAKDQCDWPENVDCGDRVIPDTDDSVSTPGVTNPVETNPGATNPGVTNPDDATPGNNCDPSEAPAICAAGDSEGVLVAHENCNQFYKCSESKPVALTCPPNLLYNPNKDQCDWPFNVDCGDRVIPDSEDSKDAGDSDSDTSEIRPPGDGISPQPPVEGSNEDCSGNSDDNGGACNCDPDQAPSICAVESSDGILIAHENCNQFYLCDNGRPVPFKCPENTLYNPVTQMCEWAFNVECGDRIIPDPENNVTESKENDSEVEEEIVGPCNCNPEEAPAICAVDGSSGVKIAHENCNQFYICDHSGPVAFTCNGVLLYNPYTERCDWPENIECGDRVIPERESESDENDSGDEENISNPNDDPSQAPTICAGDGSEGILVAHENCDSYYICSGGVPVSRPCNNGLLFNPNNKRCDWPNNVICGDRIVPDDCACNPRNAPGLCARPESEGQLIAHENCNQFYICSHSVPVPQNCPTSLLYNTDKELCDRPQNVNCENRLLLFSSLNKHWQSRQAL